jgi:diaminohydroxyphosphoribosylaminopyrimidine deaminase/5-amino-6-(5-phosphoribosylamino)uracil reductase
MRILAMRSKAEVAQNVAISQSEKASDRFFIDRALMLAWLAAGHTDPNPLVGAVVVSNGVVVGVGYHQRAGSAHAEVIALDEAGARAKNSTLYVTLEPCSHQGKTPPCVDRIVASGVRRVVVCTLDPDPRVRGKGIKKLIENSIEVDVGILPEQAVLLNLPYFKRQLSLGGAVTIKVAMTIDGRIASAPGMRDTITGSQAQQYVNRLRAENDAVIIGIDTLLTDQPRLDCRRLSAPSDPLPVVLDTQLRFPVDYPWIREGRKFCICCSESVDAAKAQIFEKTSGQIIRCISANGAVDVKDVIARLAENGISSLLVEGGGRVLTSFIERDCWDALHVFISSEFFGEDGVPVYRNRCGFENNCAVSVDARQIGDDFLLRYVHRDTMAKVTESLNIK